MKQTIHGPPTYNSLTDLGNFFSLSVMLPKEQIMVEMEAWRNHWMPYNKNKPECKRSGLSLFSLNGEMDGTIDLNSVKEYNRKNNTRYGEMSFRTPTPAWKGIPSLSTPFKELEPYLGRSHFIKFDNGGFFPPHRDWGQEFRLISFINNSHESLYVLLDGKKVNFSLGWVYFMNTRLEHSVFSFQTNGIILVMNVAICAESVAWVYNHLVAN